MLQAFINIFRVPDLRRRLLFTIGILIIYRVGFWVPLPGVNQEGLAEHFKRASETATVGTDVDPLARAVGHVAELISMFSGGNLGQSTLFGLGIMPYISAAIIFQLLGTVSEQLKEMQKDPAGRQKFQEWIRYATVPLCVIQAFMFLRYLQVQELVYPQFMDGFNGVLFWVSGVIGLTAGTVFLMWLGEQIDKYGIGNGASLIITAGILARMPVAVIWVVKNFEMNVGSTAGKIGPDTVIFLIIAFIVVVAGAVMITQGQRRIPVQQAKHTRGRRVYGGQKSYLPLRVNHGGVMPIIFASSLMIVPSIIFPWLFKLAENNWFGTAMRWVSGQMQQGQILYTLIYIGLIYFFAYFWTTVQFQPKEMASQLREHGSFIPGRRPGPRTAEYLEMVMERITYAGAGFLAIIAVVPSVISAVAGIPPMVSAFLGGTGLLITVSVMLDFVQRIEANLMMRNYGGFLSSSSGGSGPRIRGSRG